MKSLSVHSYLITITQTLCYDQYFINHHYGRNAENSQRIFACEKLAEEINDRHQHTEMIWWDKLTFDV